MSKRYTVTLHPLKGVVCNVTSHERYGVTRVTPRIEAKMVYFSETDRGESQDHTQGVS